MLFLVFPPNLMGVSSQPFIDGGGAGGTQELATALKFPTAMIVGDSIGPAYYVDKCYQ